MRGRYLTVSQREFCQDRFRLRLLPIPFKRLRLVPSKLHVRRGAEAVKNVPFVELIVRTEAATTRASCGVAASGAGLVVGLAEVLD